MQPGERIQYAGHDWYVNSYNPYEDTYQLVRYQLVRKTADESPCTTVTKESLRRARNEQRMKEYIEAEGQPYQRRLWQALMGVHTWDQPPVSTASAAEDCMWAKLAGYGIEKQDTGAMAEMIKSIAVQFDALAKQAIPSADSMRKLGDVMRQEGYVDDEGELEPAGAQELANVKYETPEAAGVAVLWRKPGGSWRAGVYMGEWDSIGNYECELVASLADAWTFVDYLNDEELGEAKAIRKDARVLFCNEDGWEAMTAEPVPEAWR
jgi:hypothetical protein